MSQNRYYSSTALPTTLYANLSSSSQTVQVVSDAGMPTSYPFTILAEWGTTNAEVITVTQAASAGSGYFEFDNCIRGVDGTTGVAHTAGVSMVHGVSAEDYNEPQVHIGSLTQGGPTAHHFVIPTALKTGTYAAAANDFVLADASGGNVTVTLPTAPADATAVSIKMVKQTLPNTVTVNRGGSDVFNVASGATSLTLKRLFQTADLQYEASSSVWIVRSTDPAELIGTPSNLYPSAPTAAASATQTLAGFGHDGSAPTLFTPASSGLVAVTFGGDLSNGTSGDNTQITAQYGPVYGPATTVASGSNVGQIANIASWGGTYGGNGVLDVASTSGWPTGGGTFWVASHGGTWAQITYTGISGNSFTGCTYTGGSTFNAPTASPQIFTAPTSSFALNDTVILEGSVSTGFTDGTLYYVSAPSTDTFELASVSSGSAINGTGSAGNGTVTGIVGTGGTVTGIPPNGVSSAGTQFGPTHKMKPASSGQQVPFSMTSFLTLTPGQEYWFDVSSASLTSGALTALTNPAFSIVELH